MRGGRVLPLPPAGEDSCEHSSLRRCGLSSHSGRKVYRSGALRPVALVTVACVALYGGLICVTFSDAAAFALPPAVFGATRRGVQDRRLQRRAGHKASEWRLGIGGAIDVLREDVPSLISSGSYVPDYSIYSNDIVFEDARLPSFRLKGLGNYRAALEAIQWSVRAACDHRRLDILTVSPPVGGVIHMRWRMQLFVKDPLASAKTFLGPSMSWANPTQWGLREPTIVEGYSRYEVDPWTAKIVRHSIEITNPPTPLADLLNMQPGALANVFSGATVGVPTVR